MKHYYDHIDPFPFQLTKPSRYVKMVLPQKRSICAADQNVEGPGVHANRVFYEIAKPQFAALLVLLHCTSMVKFYLYELYI